MKGYTVGVFVVCSAGLEDATFDALADAVYEDGSTAAMVDLLPRFLARDDRSFSGAQARMLETIDRSFKPFVVAVINDTCTTEWRDYVQLEWIILDEASPAAIRTVRSMKKRARCEPLRSRRALDGTPLHETQAGVLERLLSIASAHLL